MLVFSQKWINNWIDKFWRGDEILRFVGEQKRHRKRKCSGFLEM
jgi:hypothetical protein